MNLAKIAVAVLALGAAVAFFHSFYIFLALFSFLVLVLTFKKPRWLLFFLALWLPLEPLVLNFVPADGYLYARYFSEALIYFFALVMLIKMAAGGKHWKRTPIDLFFWLFVLVLAVSVILNFVPPTAALLGLRQILRFPILFFAVVALYPPRESIRRLLAALFVLIVLESVLGLIQFLAGGRLDSFLIPSAQTFFEPVQIAAATPQFWTPGTRIFATLGRYDQFGFFLVIFLLLAAGFLYQRGFWLDRRELLAILILGGAALILTASRASWFGFLFGFFLISVWLMRDRRVFFGFLFTALILGGYALSSRFEVSNLLEERGRRQGLGERFLESFSAERWRAEYLGLGRLFFWVNTPLLVVRERPFFGWGPGQYGGGAAAALSNRRVYEQVGLPFGIYGTEGYIDNNWLSLWGETGTLGLILYLGMFLVLARAAYRVWRFSTDPLTRGLALGFLGIILAVSFGAFWSTRLEVRTTAFYFWLLAALVVVLGRREKLI